MLLCGHWPFLHSLSDQCTKFICNSTDWVTINSSSICYACFQVLKAVMNPKAIPATQAWVRNATMKGNGTKVVTNN